ncbi:glutathione transport system permease protein GsiD [Arthrobacter sp. Hiyo4]|nr:glutathione transport system permease protein GsiD [Arthrobacter sp. Hiyo4]
MGIISIAILLAMASMTLFADVLAPFDENFANISKTLAAPDGFNILGTDSSGRDVWSRLLFGAQLTLSSALLCAAVAIAIGLPAGLVAGYYAGKFEAVSNWVVSILMSLPGLIVLLTIRAAFGPSVWIAMIAFGVLISPSYFRLTRSAVQSVRNELYVDAARVSGLSDLSIITRHIFSVVRAPIIIQTAAIAGVAIAIQSGLEFLGLGDPAKATWGVMLSEGFKNVYLTPTLLFWPALAMALTIGALVLLGNAIRDALEDGEKIKHRRKVRTKSTTAAPAVGAAATRAARKTAAAVEAGTEHHLVKVTNLGVGYPRQTAPSRKWWTTSPSTLTAAKSSASWANPARVNPRPPSPSWACCRTLHASWAGPSSSMATTPSLQATKRSARNACPSCAASGFPISRRNP